MKTEPIFWKKVVEKQLLNEKIDFGKRPIPFSKVKELKKLGYKVPKHLIKQNHKQLNFFIKKLSFDEKFYLCQKLISEMSNEKKLKFENKNSLNDFQKLLLQGPTMNGEQYENYLQLRKNFNEWTQKLFV